MSSDHPGPQVAAGTASPRATALRLVIVSVVGAALMIGAYLLFVRTWPGQRLDDILFESRKETLLAARRVVAAVLRLLTIPGIALGCAAIAIERARRGAWRSGALAVGAVGLTLAAARLIKVGAGRPELADLAWSSHENTFPSGHTAAVTAVLLAAVAVGGAPRRWWTVSAAATLAAMYSAGMVSTGWHRPSDVVGAVGLALAIVAVVVALDVLRSPTPADPPVDTIEGGATATSTLQVVWPAAAVALSLLVVVPVALRTPSAAASGRSLAAFVLSMVACAVVAAAAVLLLDRVRWGGRHHHPLS